MPRITHDSIASCQYFRSLLVPAERRRIVKHLADAFRRHCPDAGAIAFTGVSGALIGPALADRLRKPVIIVRKPADDTHSRDGGSPRLCEGYAACGSYVIVDDFVETGATVRRMRVNIKQWFDRLPWRVRGGEHASAPKFLGVLQALRDQNGHGVWWPAALHTDKLGPVDGGGAC